MIEIKFSSYNKTLRFNMFAGIFFFKYLLIIQCRSKNQAAYSVQSYLDLKVIESRFSSSRVNTSQAEGWLYVVNRQSGCIASPR